MTDIDLTTGLPELPEGHYWRLDRHSVSIRKRLPNTEWKRRYSDHRGLLGFYESAQSWGEHSTQETKTQVEQVKTSVWVNHWWSWKAKYKTVTKEGEVTYYRYVNRSTEVVNVPTAYTGETDTIYGPGVSTYERTPDKIVKLREVLTRDNVLTLCEKALKELDGLTLQGDYPPKKFDRD